MNRLQICLAAVIAVFAASDGLAQQSNILNSRFAHVAPEDCWAYSAWGPAGKYDSKSTNHSEQLLAEPDVQAFMDDLIKRVGLIGPAMLADRPAEQQQLIHSIGPKLAKAMFTRAGCVYLEDIQFDRNQMPSRIDAALVLDVGADAESLVDEMATLFAAENETGKKVTIETVDFSKFLIAEDPKMEILIGSWDEVMIVGVGEESAANAVRRLNAKQAPSWLKNFKSNRHLKRTNSLGYINAVKIRDAYENLLGAEGAMMVGFAGLGNIDAIETCSGFSQSDSVSRMLIQTDGQPEGVFALSSSSGIESTDLQQFPSDCLFAVGLSFDPGKALRFIRLANMQVSGRDELSSALEEIKQETGIDLKRDVIDNLGKTWTIYNGKGDGWMTGLTVTGAVEDPQKLSAAIDHLIKKVLLETSGNRYAPKFTKRAIGDSDVFTMRIPGMGFPLQPSWCITQNRIIVGLYPQTVQSALQRNESDTLIDQAQFAFLSEPFSEPGGDANLLGMTYVDSRTQFEFTYPYLQMVMGMGQGMFRDILGMRSESADSVGMLFEGIRLPPARTIHRHLQPSLGAIRLTKMGIELETRQTVPAMDASYLAPLAIGMVLPAVQQVRTSARRTQSTNNIRQQVLASLNYESAHQQFPAGYSVNQQGEKLLSWRVHILPFIEENNLYEQFKHDEPWDSPNNIRLVDKMPDVFRSPLSKAEKGKTVYRGIGGKTGVLGPPRGPGASAGVGFGNITDGSSNTLFLVETSDQLAVPWTQPDEGLKPEEFDLSQIFGMYPNGTNAGRCDGSTFFVPASIDKNTFKLMMEMNDGNIIPQIIEETDRPSRQERANNRDAINKLFSIDNGEVELTVDNMLSESEKTELARRQQVNKFREITLAFHNYESAHRGFPAAFNTDEAGKPLLSWRVHLLPYLEESALYNEFRMDEPWDSQHNRALLKRMPDCYQIPTSAVEAGKTTILAIGGPEGVIPKPTKNGRESIRGLGFRFITDGTSNTLLLVEANDDLAIEWTKPEEFVPSDATIKQLLSRPHGFAATMCDGSAHQIRPQFPMDIFKAMLTRNGGEIVDNLWDQLRKK